MMNSQSIASLKQSRDWLAVEEHLRFEIAKLDTLPDTTGKDDRAIAIEVIARAQAIKVLRDILKPFLGTSTQGDVEQKVADTKRDAGLD